MRVEWNFFATLQGNVLAFYDGHLWFASVTNLSKAEEEVHLTSCIHMDHEAHLGHTSSLNAWHTSCSHQRCTNTCWANNRDGTRLQDFYRRDTKRKYHANKVNMHASEDAFSHNVDMPSKLVELKIARMQCIAVFANVQTKIASPWC